MSHGRKKLSTEPITITIESLSHEGRGIARVDGKTVFVEGALPGEEAVIQYTRRHPRFNEARVLEITQPSPERVTAMCEFYNVCGGCSFQHAGPRYQIEHKQAVMLEQLRHHGGVTPVEVMPPLTGPVWGYRRRARLGVKYVEKKQKVLVGFREKHSALIADIARCEVLHPAAGNLLADLQVLIGGLSIYHRLPQIEVAVADNVTALVIRHLQDLTAADRKMLREFEHKKNVRIYLQPGGLDTVAPLSPELVQPLVYALPGHEIDFEFQPTDFIQVNAGINGAMIDLALKLLMPGKQDEVLDLFCGLGNFSLPLAKSCRHVTGVEGDSGLITRAKLNAEHNNIRNVEFHAAQLADRELQASFLDRQYDAVLLDPPRTGALEIIECMPFENTQRVVYVSCNPATLARDAGILVRDKGFHLQQAGVMDMFPHTAHVESIAQFVR